MKRTTLMQLFAGIAAALMLLTLIGCGSNAQTAGAIRDDSLQKVIDAGQLVLGLDEGFPPMGFAGDTGELIGFDLDVAQEVCNRLGVALVKKGINWDEKENDLNAGRIDCIWNGLSVTPARAEAMNLSDPYMKNELIVVVPGSSDAIVLRDLKGRSVGVQSGSTAQEVLETSELRPDVTVRAYETVTVLLDQLDRGKVDAALIDSVSAYYFIFSSDEPYFILSESLAEEDYAIGFRKGDQALRDRVQEIISDMKADGSLGEISKAWFGSDITTVR